MEGYTVALQLIICILLLCSDASLICERPGFFCFSETKYAWCSADDLSARPTEWECTTGNICKCGETVSTFGPCAWAFEDVNGTCQGHAGSVLKDFSSHPRALGGVYQRQPSEHLPFSVQLNQTIWRDQLEQLINKPFYDDPALFRPADSSNYHCSFHQHSAYDANPTQLWIGYPDNTVNLHGRGWFPRLPDSTTALYLAYAMDHYGINPTLMLSLMAVKSGASLSSSSSALFSEVTASSSYEESTDNLKMALSVLATRMATSETRAEGKPLFVSHRYHEHSGELTSLLNEWNMNVGRATILTALELHWIHTAVITLDRLGMRSNNWERRSRYDKDYLEWATALHVHQFGIVSNALGAPLSACAETQDPLTDCRLDKNKILHDVREICTLTDRAQSVYDYPITEAMVNEFLETLHWSYPYQIVQGQKNIQLDWSLITNATMEAFAMLASNRANKDPLYDGRTISLRYDWRTCLAVTRSFLPVHEPCVGLTFHGVDHEFYGIFSDEPYGDRDEWPLDECFAAGSGIDQCSLIPQSATIKLAPLFSVALIIGFIFLQ